MLAGKMCDHAFKFVKISSFLNPVVAGACCRYLFNPIASFDNVLSPDEFSPFHDREKWSFIITDRTRNKLLG